MTVINNDARNQYIATLNQTIFNYDFEIASEDDIQVFKRALSADPNDATDILQLTTDYTVTGVGVSTGGTIILTSGAALNDIITLQGNAPPTRDTSFTQGGVIQAQNLNLEFDNDVLIYQTILGVLNFLVPRYQKSAIVGTKDLVLPVLGANQIWQMNETNTALEAVLFDPSTSASALEDMLASHTVGEGASMIGLQNQGSVSNKTVQDLANLDIVCLTDPTAVLLNGKVLGAYALLLAGGTMTGNINMGSNRITNMLDPSAQQDAATKAYVDSVASGLNIQPACYAATTATLNATYNNGASGVGATLTNAGALTAFSVDGISPPLNSRILFKDQAAPEQNGIYVLTTVGDAISVPWVATRATDFDTPAEIQPGDLVLVLNGSVNASTSYVQTATVTIVGTDAIVWNQFGSDVNGIITGIQNESYTYVNDTGAADAYVATLAPVVTSYVAGLRVQIKVANANTGASTLNVNGLGVKTIKTVSGLDLQAGDMIANMIADLIYDGTNFQLQNRNIAKRIQNESFNYILDTGAANAYVATLVPSVTSLVAGLRVSLKIAATNAAVGASTLNVNGLGATSIKLTNGSDPLPGSILAGMIADLRYDGTNFQLLNAANPMPSQPNIIIGGNFTTNPWQRQVTFTAPTDGTYTADRFIWNVTGTGVVNVLKTADAPTPAQAGVYSDSCFHVDVTTADAALAATDVYSVQYRVEGYDISEAGFGQAGTRYITLSFWHKHTKTGTYCVSFRNSASDRAYIAEYTQAVTDTWEFSSITIPVDTSGTWLYTNGIGLKIHFGLGYGSNFQTPANAWTAGNYLGSANQVNAMDSTSNNFKIDLVKLEMGQVATPYPIENQQQILARCQRYYEKSYDAGVYPGANPDFNGAACIKAVAANNQLSEFVVGFKVSKRATPTMTAYNVNTGTSASVYEAPATNRTVNSFDTIGLNGWGQITTATNATAAARLFMHWTASAEL